MDMTFSILSYNQEKTVLETLESIKYQVLKYGKRKSVQLIIADDASKDRTYYIENEWVKTNHQWFSKIDVLPSFQHLGINSNFIRILDYIEGDYWKAIAGDDLLADVDIFGIINKTNNDLYINSYFMFDSSFCIGVRLTNYLYWGMPLDALKEYSKFEILPLHALGFIQSKSLVNQGYRRALERYKYVDDAPVWKYLMQNNQLKVHYSNVPITLYRVSGQNICMRGENPFYELFKSDLAKLYFENAKCSKDLIVKYISYINYKKFNNDNRLFSIINPYEYYKKYRMWKNCKKVEELVKEMEKEYKDRNEIYLKEIHEISNEMYVKIVVR